MKKKYYKVIADKEHWWICSEQDLLNSLVEWLEEHKKLKVEIKMMTSSEFNELPEFEW